MPSILPSCSGSCSAAWAAYNGDPFAVSKGGACLPELLTEGLEKTVDWPDRYPLGVLFAHLYYRFRESPDHTTMPIPRDFTVNNETAGYFSSGALAPVSEARLLRSITSEVGGPASSLFEIFGDDTRNRPRSPATSVCCAGIFGRMWPYPVERCRSCGQLVRS